MSNLIIYHANCVDGLGALWAATKHLGLYSEMHAATYGSEPPDVPHVMVYPERGTIPVVKTPNKIKIGAGKFTLEGVGFSLPKPSSRW